MRPFLLHPRLHLRQRLWRRQLHRQLLMLRCQRPARRHLLLTLLCLLPLLLSQLPNNSTIWMETL